MKSILSPFQFPNTITGNDLIMEEIENLITYCYQFESQVHSMRKSLIKALKENYVNLEVTREVLETAIEKLEENHCCENHILIYVPKEVEFEKIFQTNKTLEKVVDWAIIHDTNTNVVNLIGKVPENYIKER